jgi:hypothetical protein
MEEEVKSPHSIDDRETEGTTGGNAHPGFEEVAASAERERLNRCGCWSQDNQRTSNMGENRKAEATGRNAKEDPGTNIPSGTIGEAEAMGRCGGVSELLEEDVERKKLSSTESTMGRLLSMGAKERGPGFISSSGGQLNQDLKPLKSDSGGHSALISFGSQVRQVFFEPHDAIQRVTQKINEIWNIPRKIYWLSVNGKHESLVTSWPQNSSVQIRIKGPAGYDPQTDESGEEQTEAIPLTPEKIKFKKGSN